MADVFPAADFARLRATQMADAVAKKAEEKKRAKENARILSNKIGANPA